ncbi:MAG: hypothetical protein J0L82_13690 [Deltaproteobacteria bacterium]|nr:hypothetical protein [Deltaproteobacteria bacterium]
MFKAKARFQVTILVISIFLIESLVQPLLALESSAFGQRASAAEIFSARQTVEQSRNDFKALQNQVSLQMIEAMKTGFGGRDPMLRDLMSVDMGVVDAQVPDFRNAPVDSDPFFMRSQKWVESREQVSDYAVIGTEQTTEILLPENDRKLVLDIPLRSLIATSEYLFFTLHPKSDLFDRLAGEKNSDGEGLFVVETALLVSHAKKNTPVPVFFLPIMGRGWRSGLTAIEVVQGDILAVTNGREVIPFAMKDIREMVQISKINLDLSVMISLTKRDADGIVSGDRLMPAPGSTALLGLVLTGLDTRRPGYNFFKDFKALGVRRDESKSFRLIAESLFMKILGVEVAEAQTEEDPVAAAIKRSAIFGSIVGITIITAFVLKYKVPSIRLRLDEIHKYRRALDPETVDREKMKGFREFMRIEGSILASIAQFPLITPGIAVQYFVDRHLPSLGAGDHTLMRKVLHQTVYPNLRHFGKISVNEKVTILGTGYAATAGIGLGALHYFYLLPMFIQAVSPSLPPGLSYALNESFSSANRQTQAVLFTNLLVGASIGILRGPADFTMDAKSQVVEELYARVDNDLRRLGLNPNDPKIQSRREEMRDALVNLTLIQKGLPSTAEILFDTMSLYSSIAKSRGFAAPSNSTLLANLNPLAADTVEYEKDNAGNLKLGEDGKPVIKEGSFILSSRRGLLPNVLSRALVQAKAWHEASPSPDTEKAVKLVELLISDSERLRKSLPIVAKAVLRYLESPSALVGGNQIEKSVRDQDLRRLRNEIREISTRAMAFRQLIVMASYEGPTEYTARYLPVTWTKEFGSGAANMAVLYLRQAVASQLDGATVDNLVAKREDILRYRNIAKEEALQKLKEVRPDLASKSDAEILDDPNLQAELLQRANIAAKAHGDQQRAEENANRFKPESGWIEQWRHRQSLTRAEARLAQYALQSADKPELLTKENLELQLRDFYTHESGKQIGLRIQELAPESEKDKRSAGRAPWQSENEKYETMLKEIQEKSELVAKQQFETLGMKTYMAKLSPLEQTRLRLQTHASIYLAAYRDATTMTDIVSALDPAQPGVTQGLRQALTRQTDKDLQVLTDLEAERSYELDRKLLRFRRAVVSTVASTANRGLRIIDSMFNDQSIDRGALGVIQRRVPFAEELVSANIRNLKFWPVAFSVSWAWSHFALGTGIGYSFWVTSILTQGIFVMAPVQWLFRNYRMQSFKPYDSNKPGWSGVFHLGGKYGVAEMLAYSVTFVAIMPAVLLSTDVGRILTERVGSPLIQSMQSFSMLEVSTALTVGILSYIAGSKVYENWKMKTVMARLSLLKEETSTVNVARDTKAVQTSTEAIGFGGSCEGSFVGVGR